MDGVTSRALPRSGALGREGAVRPRTRPTITVLTRKPDAIGDRRLQLFHNRVCAVSSRRSLTLRQTPDALAAVDDAGTRRERRRSPRPRGIDDDLAVFPGSRLDQRVGPSPALRIIPGTYCDVPRRPRPEYKRRLQIMDNQRKITSAEAWPDNATVAFTAG